MGIHKATWLASAAALVAFSGNAAAAPLLLQDVPLFISSGADPNVMLMIDSSGSMFNIVPDEPYDENSTAYGDCSGTVLPATVQTEIRITAGGSPYFKFSTTPGAVCNTSGGTEFDWGTGTGNGLTGRPKGCFNPTASYKACLAGNSGGATATKSTTGYTPGDYTGHYLNWYFGFNTATAAYQTQATGFGSGARIKQGTKDRITIARTAAQSLVSTMSSSMRTGLSRYNGSDGGQLLESVGPLDAAKRTALNTAINGITAGGFTPLAETLSDIGFYFSRGATTLTLHPATSPTPALRTDVFNNGYTRSTSWGSGSPPITLSCQKSFAVLMTDGRPNDDQNISASLRDYDGDCVAASPACLSFDRKVDRNYEALGSDYLDDVAQALFEIDLRPDLVKSQGRKNNLATYLISFAEEDAINDPLMQDAADQGGGKKFVAGNEAQLTTAFASALSDIVQKTASASSASVNSGSISNDTRVYQAKFNSANWTGQLLSFPINTADGTLITDPTDPRVWDASDQLPSPTNRNIITVNSDGSAVPFRYNAIGANPSIDATRKSQLGDTSTAVTPTSESEDMLNYLRGDGTKEGVAPRNFRTRIDAGGANKLGDIVSSAPLFVGRPPFRYRDSLETSAYSAFVTTNASRQGIVYVGGNDGMLHGFNADNGREVFAFIPSPVFTRLPNIAAKTYAHEFFVDGSPSMGDAFFSKRGPGSASWHTVLVGGLNKGGRGIYALDVTNPATLAAAEDNASEVLLWEFTSANDSDLGLTYSQPTVVKLQDGTWAAVFGNGYNSGSNKAVLYVVNIADGSLIAKLESSPSAPPGVTWDNGLSTPSLVDVDGDRKVDLAYAGDLYGNMWRFDLSAASSGSWTMTKLFAATDPSGNGQPITVRPEVGRGPRGQGTLVLFGTGKFLELADKSDTRVQTFYGIFDQGGALVARSALLQQSISQEFSVDPDGGGPLPAFNARVSTSNPLIASNKGWYMNLVPPPPAAAVGEKQVTNPIVRDGKVVFTTLLPNVDPCGAGGTSWVMELDMLSGAKLTTPPFDINHDGQFTTADMVALPASGGMSQLSGIQFVGAGILQSPGVIEGETGGGVCIQYKYMPDSAGNIQVVNENCGPGGLGRQSWRQIR